MPSVAEDLVCLGESAVVFGVFTRSEGDASGGCGNSRAASQRVAPCVLFVNSAPVHRAGHSRIHVVLARALAHAGFRSFRFDVGGVGDALLRARGGFAEDAERDLSAVMDALFSRFGCRRFLLFGCCSGANAALAKCLTDCRVAGVFCVDETRLCLGELSATCLRLPAGYCFVYTDLGRALPGFQVPDGDAIRRLLPGIAVRIEQPLGLDHLLVLPDSQSAIIRMATEHFTGLAPRATGRTGAPANVCGRSF